MTLDMDAAVDCQNTSAYPEDDMDAVVDCCDNSLSVSSSNDSHIHTKPETLRKQANAP